MADNLKSVKYLEQFFEVKNELFNAAFGFRNLE